MVIYIFTPYGKTFTFYKVTNLKTNESMVSFRYIAMSDDRTKFATFYVANIVGYSILDMGE